MTNQTVSIKEIAVHYTPSTETSLYDKVERMLFSSVIARRTVAQIYAQFAEEHPECETMMFDAHFMQQWVMPLAKQAYQEGTMLSLSKLLWAWDRQFGAASDSLRKSRQQQMAPLAMTFLVELNVALS